MTDSIKRPVLLFDSECRMCSRFKQGLSFLDNGGKINFVSIHDESEFNKLTEEFEQLTFVKCHDKVHLITEENAILQGSEVIPYLLNLVPGISKLSWLLDSDVAKNALDAFYNKVNDVRKSDLNRCEKCKK